MIQRFPSLVILRFRRENATFRLIYLSHKYIQNRVYVDSQRRRWIANQSTIDPFFSSFMYHMHTS